MQTSNANMDYMDPLFTELVSSGYIGKNVCYDTNEGNNDMSVADRTKQHVTVL